MTLHHQMTGNQHRSCQQQQKDQLKAPPMTFLLQHNQYLSNFQYHIIIEDFPWTGLGEIKIVILRGRLKCTLSLKTEDVLFQQNFLICSPYFLLCDRQTKNLKHKLYKATSSHLSFCQDQSLHLSQRYKLIPAHGFGMSNTQL